MVTQVRTGGFLFLAVIAVWWAFVFGRSGAQLLAGAQNTPVPSNSGLAGMAMAGEKPDPSIPRASLERGGNLAPFRVEGGLKVFDLTAGRVQWSILPDRGVVAWAYNGQVSGPVIRVAEGDRLRINFKNELPAPTTVHWHGLPVPYQMDGVPGISQPVVPPGGTFVYEFDVRQAGTFLYHSHVDEAKQIGLGLSGALIVDSRTEPPPDQDIVMVLQEWTVDPSTGETFGAAHGTSEGNFFTINGKAYPATEPIMVNAGERVRVRLINPGQVAHPMHLHGHSFKIVATDGHPVPEGAQLTKDTVNIATGERYDIEFIADNPGIWFFHCHIAHHMTNDGQEPGGLISLVQYPGFAVPTPLAVARPTVPPNVSPVSTPGPGSMPGMGH